MIKCFVPFGVLALLALFVGNLVSCDGVTPLSGTVDVADFTVAAGQTRLVSGDVTINAAGRVDIAGALVADGGNGQSITIQAEGNVNISGTVGAGDGPVGADGGGVVIVSNNGNVTLTDSASIGAGDGGAGQTTSTESTTTKGNSGSVRTRMISGGAGGQGGSVTLKAPNGAVTLADKQGIIHLGNGGNGATIQIHGDDLLTVDVPEQLENGGGDSGVFAIEALSFNGTQVSPGSAVEINSDTFFSGGQGGIAGDFFFGEDENGNSTWPDSSDASASVLSDSGRNRGQADRKIFTDKRRRGANGGDGYLDPGAGGSLRIRGINATASGVDGQNVFAFGGWGGDCLSPACLEGGNGGNADATGGNGARGQHPNGAGGNGGNADATGGLGGYSLFSNGRHGDARAFGGNAGKGGGKCPNDVTTTGGRGGMGGGAFASADSKTKAIAVAGNSGDGGDGTNFSGPVGSSLLANAFGGPGSVQTQGKKGNPGATCPRVQALQLKFSIIGSPYLSAPSTIKLSCVSGAEITGPEDNCNCRHVHGTITIAGVTGGPFADPDPSGCGHGCVVEVLESTLDHPCK